MPAAGKSRHRRIFWGNVGRKESGWRSPLRQFGKKGRKEGVKDRGRGILHIGVERGGKILITSLMKREKRNGLPGEEKTSHAAVILIKGKIALNLSAGKKGGRAIRVRP